MDTAPVEESKEEDPWEPEPVIIVNVEELDELDGKADPDIDEFID
jgi:hypothetical protein